MEKDDWEEVKYTCNRGIYMRSQDKVHYVVEGSPLFEALNDMTEEEFRTIFREKDEEIK